MRSGWCEALDFVHHVELGPLSAHAARELIELLVGGRGMLPPECVDFVIAHTGGVALHIEQMR